MVRKMEFPKVKGVDSVELQLPYPPSVNTYWRRSKAGMFISAKGREYKHQVGWACRMMMMETPPFEERLVCTVVAYKPDARKRDIDNILKALLDSMEDHVYKDDSQIRELHVTLHDKTEGKEGVYVKIVKQTE
jgi:crossover junction endodeoxyribonuclease RusA